MDKHLDLIWKKIDGSLSEKEALKFNELVQNNKDFLNLYKVQTNLDAQLKMVPQTSAPHSLVNNVLQKITLRKINYSKEYNSFKGIKIISLVSAGLLTLIVIATMTLNINFNATVYPELTQWLNQISIPSPLKGIENYSTYLLVLLPGLALIWLDKMFKKETITINIVQ